MTHFKIAILTSFAAMITSFIAAIIVIDEPVLVALAFSLFIMSAINGLNTLVQYETEVKIYEEKSNDQNTRK